MANYPIINVGLGTSGGEIVTAIAKMIRREGDQWCKDYVENIVLLSESEPPPEIDAQAVRNLVTLCPSNPATTVYVHDFLNADARVSEQFKKWYPMRNGEPVYPAAASFAEGCGGFRPGGRLLLHRMRAQVDSIKAILLSIIHMIQARADQQIYGGTIGNQDIDLDKFVCNVFGSLAGGTASGLFLDFAHLLRSAASDGGVEARIHGYFLTGDTCYLPIKPNSRSNVKVMLQRRNTIRALSEIAVVQSMAGWTAAFKDWPNTIGSDDVSTSPALNQNNVFPYDTLFLIGGSREGERKAALPETKQYFHMLANAVGQRLTSRVDVERMGSIVDLITVHRDGWSQQAPKRANEIGSLGYLHIRLPKKKIAAVVLRHIADHVLAEQMKKYDPDLGSRTLTEIRNRLSMDNLAVQWFSPPVESFSAKTGEDPVAEDKKTFSDAWVGALARMKTHYEIWNDPGNEDDTSAKAAKKRFLAEAEKMTKHMLEQCLATESFSFGTWKVVLEKLQSEISKQIDDFNKRINDLNKVLLAGDGFEKQFGKTVSELSTQYPGKGVLGFFDQRKGWHGHQVVEELYKDLSNTVRVRAQLQVVVDSLGEWRDDLKRLSVLRSLIGKRASYAILKEAALREDSEFNEANLSMGSTQHEVVSTREEVGRFVAKKILKDGQVLGKGTQYFVRAFCRALRGANQAGQGDPLAALNALRASFRVAPQDVVSMHDNAWEDPAIQDAVTAIRETLRSAFKEQEIEVNEQLEQLTIWDAITASIQGVGEQARKELLDLFGRFKSMGKVFWNPTGAQENMAVIESRVQVFCDKDAAYEHLKRLQINDENFLELLLRQAFECMPDIMPKPGYSELLSFIEKWGIQIRNPEFSEVDHILSGKLTADPVECWSDSRFPEWMKEVR
ncbi:MAG: tubulin-like doman-containing protein [Verrucomicrobiota bacterium]